MSQPAPPAKADLYIKARQEGLGAREAARRAGYAHGVPSATARRLWHKVLALQAQPELTEMFQEKVNQRAAQVRAAREWVRAGELLGV